jgi:hypothetical protein
MTVMKPMIVTAAALGLLAGAACAQGDKGTTNNATASESEPMTVAENDTAAAPTDSLASEPLPSETTSEPLPSETLPSETASIDESDPAAPTELASLNPAEQDDAAATTHGDRVGMGVFDSKGAQVGVIEEIVVAEDGTEQAVILVGAYLGLGAKKIAVPTSDLTLNADGKGYGIALTAEEIEAAPEYVSPEPQPEPQQ